MRYRFLKTGFALGVLMAIMASCNSNTKSEKKFDKAVTVSDSVVLITNEIEHDSSDYTLWKTRARLYLKRGNVDVAFRDINRALELNRTDPDLFIILSDLYFTIGKVDNSLSSIRKAIDLQPDNPAGYLKMARVKLILQKYPSATAFADKVIALNANNPEAYYIKAISSLEQKDSVKALTFMKIAANLDTAFFAANFNIAVVLDAMNDTIAGEYFKKSIQLKPDNTLARYSLGMFYQKQGKYDSALATYNRLIALHPDNAEAHFNKGFIYLTEWLDFEKAANEFNKAIEIKPDYTAAVYNLGRTYEVMGKKALAAEKYREAMKLTTNYPLAIDGLNRLENNR
ncbi:MAG: hypothetical protein DRJ09_00340 [Bacteroidetes bacterium]|nr:MAG: hypothetical protein DRJ09_00340 [Bacteroidota bacterium]